MDIISSLFPVFMFLFALIVLDTFKLITLRSILVTILLGCIVSLPAYVINSVALEFFRLDEVLYKRYGSPVIEEILKAAYVVYLLRTKKIGFMVDAAIYGFAVGAGFAFIENIFYLRAFPNSNLLFWIARGLGTAIMHGGTAAIFGIITKNISDHSGSLTMKATLLGLVVAAAFHSFYNHFFLSPLLPTAVLLVTFPIVFRKSEQATRQWLEVGFDTDVQVLGMIISGDLSQTKIGIYLQSFKSKFSGEIVVDMLCLLRLHLELSIRAKGILLMREAGFRPAIDAELLEKFSELKYLEKSIGITGKLAIAPLLHTSSRDLWQMYMLGRLASEPAGPARGRK